MEHADKSSGTRRTTLTLLRAVHGVTQTQLAERAGIARQTVSNIERGAHTPTVTTASAITRALGYTDPSLVFPELFT